MRRAFLRGFLVLLFALIAVLRSAGQGPLSAAPTISGFVTGPCEEVIPRVKVTVTREPAGQEYSAITDEHGHYRIPGVAPGSYSVEFVKPEFRTESRTGVLVSPLGVTEVSMRLVPVRGRVRRKDLLCPPFTSDESFWVGTQAAGGLAGAPAGTIAGRVVDPAGAVIPGAQVTVIPEPDGEQRSTKTDDNGLYRLTDMVPGKYSLRFAMRGFRTETKTGVFVSPSSVTQLNVKLAVGTFSGPIVEADVPLLPGTGLIAGSVLDPQGVGLAGARIAIVEDKTGWNYDTASDCSGSYRRANLPAGSYHVRFEAKWFRSDPDSYAVRVSPSQTMRLDSKMQLVVTCCGPEVTMVPAPPPTGAIQGRVTEATGEIGPARITATEKTSEQHYETTTDSNGVFRLLNLPAGSYSLRYQAAEREPASGQDVTVVPPDVACADIHVPAAKEEKVEVCSGPLIESAPVPAPPGHGIALQIYASSNVVSKGSDVSLAVTLTNMTTHPIFIQGEPNSAQSFRYNLYAFGPCSSPGQLRGHEPVANAKAGPLHRLAPGETLTESVALSTTQDLSMPGAYTIVVSRPDTSGEVSCCDEPRNAPMIRSNYIKVAVMAPPQ